MEYVLNFEIAISSQARLQRLPVSCANMRVYRVKNGMVDGWCGAVGV